jgi:hypothetical protein
VNAVPELKVDGIISGDPWDPRDDIDSRLAARPPCTIEVSPEIDGSNVVATVRVTAVQDMHASDTRLFVALVHLCYSSHWYAFRRMAPSTNGQAFTLDAGDTYEYTGTLAATGSWDFSKLRVIAFVQRYNTKEVLQAGYADVSPPLTLFLNEFMIDNTMTIQDPQGEYEDWVEVYNPGPDPINFSGLYLTNDWGDPDRWAFPDTTVEPGDFLLVWCDNDVGDPGLHSNFSLSAYEELAIYDDLVSCRFLIDHIDYNVMQPDISYGRVCDGKPTWAYFDYPTPWRSNGVCADTVDNLTALPAGDDIQLIWQGVPGAANYTIYRHGGVPFEPEQPDSIGSTTDTTYLDIGILLTDPTAFYRVKASP